MAQSTPTQNSVNFCKGYSIVKFHSLILLIFVFAGLLLGGCDSAPAELTDAEKTEVNTLVTRLVEGLSSHLVSKEEPSLSGEAYLNDETVTGETIRNRWYKLRGQYDRTRFYLLSESQKIDSIGEESIKVALDMRIVGPGGEEKEMVTKAFIYLNRKPSIAIARLVVDLETPATQLAESHISAAKDAGMYKGEGNPNWDLFADMAKNLKGDFDDFAFAAQVDGNDLLYVVKGPYKGVTYDFDQWKPAGKMGLADFEGEIILPIEYDLVHSFGGLIDGYAEIDQNGKFGLVDATGKVLLEPIYDLLLPPASANQLVMLRRAGEYGYADKQGKVTMGQSVPKLKELMDRYEFKNRLNGESENLKASEMIPLARDGGLGYASYVIPPSFLQRMKIAGYIIPVEVYDPGTYQAVNVTEQFDLGDEIQGIISMVETWTFEPRDEWHEKAYTVSTYDKSLRPLTSRSLMKTGGDITVGHYCELEDFSWKGSDTIEVKYTSRGEYYEDVHYRYFLMLPEGKVNELKSKRKYPFTEFSRIDESYLQGCFCEEIPETEWDKEKRKKAEQFYGEYWVTAHYKANEIESMIAELENESNKDSLAYPYDAANLAFLKSYLPQVQENETALLKREHKYEAW